MPSGYRTHAYVSRTISIALVSGAATPVLGLSAQGLTSVMGANKIGRSFLWASGWIGWEALVQGLDLPLPSVVTGIVTMADAGTFLGLSDPCALLSLPTPLGSAVMACRAAIPVRTGPESRVVVEPTTAGTPSSGRIQIPNPPYAGSPPSFIGCGVPMSYNSWAHYWICIHRNRLD